MSPSEDTEARRLGRELRTERTRQGLRQEDLAFAAGLSRPAIINVEQGKSGVRWETLLQVTDALGLRLEFARRGDG